MSSRITASDWIGMNCGDIVVCCDDPTHEARVEHVSQRGVARLKFLDTGWTGFEDISGLTIVRRVQSSIVYAPDHCAFVVESAKRRLQRELARG